MEKIVSLIYNKEKTSNAFFGKNAGSSKTKIGVL
jgi:hypothetical protein